MTPQTSIIKPEILLIAPGRSGRGGISGMCNALWDSTLRNDFNLRWLETGSDRGRWKNLLMFFRALLLAPFMIARANLVHIHTASYNSFRRKSIFALWAMVLRRPYILHIHGGGFPVFMRKASAAGRCFYRFILNHAKRLVTLAPVFDQAVAEYVHPEVPRLIIPNPGYLELQPRKKPVPEISLVLFSGWIEPEKGVFDLLHAFVSAPLPPTVKLAMPGKGKITEVMELARELGISDRVIVPGWQNSAEMKKWYQQADILVLPSYTEGMPMVLLEAMAHGIPIISTPVGGIPFMLPTQASAYLVSPGDVTALAERISNLASFPEKRQAYGQLLQQHYYEHFRAEIIFSEIAGLYNALARD